MLFYKWIIMKIDKPFLIIHVYIKIFFRGIKIKFAVKYRNLTLELNTCRDELLELKQAKITTLTFQLANTDILEENQTLRKELSESKSITKSWFNS